MRTRITLDITWSPPEDDPALWDWATLLDCSPYDVAVVGHDTEEEES